MRVVYTEAYRKGYAAGLKKTSMRILINGIISGFVICLLLVGSVAFAQSVPMKANDYRRDLTRISRSVWGMEAPVSSLAAQIHQESGWNPNARSHAGALGLTQFMPRTARDVAEQYGDTALPFDPRWSMLAQSRYMRDIYNRQQGINACERFAFALSGYNGGERWVQRRRALSDDPLRCLGATCDINPGILASNQKENREYSRRILIKLTPLYYEAGWGIGHCMSYSESE